MTSPVISYDRKAGLVVVGLFTVMAVTIASSFDTLGVFLLPLSKQFGWNRTQVSLIATLLQLSSAAAMPLIGLIIDRVDAKRVMLCGVVALGSALLAASRANSLAQLLAAYTVIGLANAASSIVPGALIISRWFDQRRGTAMGIVFSGFAVGEMIGNLTAGNVVPRYGWRAGYVVLAIVTLAGPGAGGPSYGPQQTRKVRSAGIAIGAHEGNSGLGILRAGPIDDRRSILFV